MDASGLVANHPAKERVSERPRLVVVSNRVPSSDPIATAADRDVQGTGGLIGGLQPALADRDALWFGWSGRSTQRGPEYEPELSTAGSIKLATVDLSGDDYNLYYTGFSNRTLWPLLHSFPDRVVIRGDTYRAYRRVNSRFADALYPMLRADDDVWVHDFHLFNLGQELRRLGWRGKTGFFLHVPFPSADLFSILPWSREILTGLLNHNLVGVQTERYLRELSDTLCTELGGNFSKGVYSHSEGEVRLGVYPVGIDSAQFQAWASQARRRNSRYRHGPTAPEQMVVLGVDRLDYTKGIPDRLRAFESMLAQHSSLRRRVSFIQISMPSRTRVPQYARGKELIDQLVGEINGRFSEEDWVPINYLYRTYTRQQLARFYRDADVCLVTPLRDGMNLVSKEFVACQGEDPGVLVLSKFTGSAAALREAIIVNPYDLDGTAEAIHRALYMPRDERRRRWRSLMGVVSKYSAKWWSDTFLADLARS